jgi:hypothetical protein
MRSSSRFLAFGVALVLLAAATARAQIGPEEARALRSRLEQRYRVLPTTEGLVLAPLGGGSVRAIEIADGVIAIDGRPVTGAEARARLGDAADLVIQASYAADAVRRTFDPVEAPAPPVEPAGPTPEEIERPGRAEPRQPVRLRPIGGRLRIGRDIRVEEDEVATRSLVAIGGSIFINGRVYDDVVAIGGNVEIGPSADVRNDVTAIGGSIWRDPSARVTGQLNELDWAAIPLRIRIDPFTLPAFETWRVIPWASLAMTLVRMLLVVLACLLALAIARDAVRATERGVRGDLLRCAVVGLATELLFLPAVILVSLLLTVSILGIPLLALVPLAFAGLVLAFLVGFTAVAIRLGARVHALVRRAPPSAGAALVTGLAVLFALTVAGRVAWIAGGAMWAIALPLGALGALIEFAAWTVGLGAAMLALVDGRRHPSGDNGPMVPVPSTAVPPAGGSLPV